MCSKAPMRVPTISRIRTWLLTGLERLWSQWTPRRQAGEIAAIAVDAMRSRRELVLENAVLRHQVNVLRRRSKRPKLHLIDRTVAFQPRQNSGVAGAGGASGGGFLGATATAGPVGRWRSPPTFCRARAVAVAA
jgi:hypothetical protein